MIPLVIAGQTVTRRPGHDTGWRRLPWAVLLAVADGPYRIQEEAGGFNLAPGGVALLPPDLRHRIRQCFPGTATLVSWVHLRCPLDDGDDLFERYAFPLHLHDPRLPPLIRRLVAAQDTVEGRLDRLATACALLQALLPLGVVAAVSHPDRPRIAPVLAWAREHLDEPLSRAALARRAGLSVARFHVVFEAVMGEAPMTWLRRQRIARAQQLLLHSRLPVAEIAARVGFPDPFHFSRCFRAACGTSPRCWRIEI